MAAAEATLTVMERENIPARSERLGQKLRAGLEELQQRHELIGDVRGKGLMQAIELVENRVTKEPATKKSRRSWRRRKARSAGRKGGQLR